MTSYKHQTIYYPIYLPLGDSDAEIVPFCHIRLEIICVKYGIVQAGLYFCILYLTNGWYKIIEIPSSFVKKYTTIFSMNYILI